MLQRLREFTRRRLDPDQRLGLRLTLGFLGVGVVAVPFLLLWLLIEDHWAPLRHLDRSIATSLNTAIYQHQPAIDVLKAISLVFGPTTFRIAGVVVAVLLAVRRHVRLAAFVIVGILGGSLLDGAVKLLAGRHRPVLAHPVAHSPGLSFPSGHALGSLVGVGVLLLVFWPVMRRPVRRAAVASSVLVVLAVGFSRVALGVHYVSDVVGGWALGAAWLLVVAAAFAVWRRGTGQPVDPAHGIEPGAVPDLINDDDVGTQRASCRNCPPSSGHPGDGEGQCVVFG